MVNTRIGPPGLPVLRRALEEFSNDLVLVLILRRQTEGDTVEDRRRKRKDVTTKIARQPSKKVFFFTATVKNVD